MSRNGTISPFPTEFTAKPRLRIQTGRGSPGTATRNELTTTFMLTGGNPPDKPPHGSRVRAPIATVRVAFDGQVLADGPSNHPTRPASLHPRRHGEVAD